MIVTSETISRVIRSWLAIEVLTPQSAKDGWSEFAADKQGQQRNKKTTVPDDPAQWEAPQDDDAPPWPLRQAATGQASAAPQQPETNKDPDEPRPWYVVVLGALPARTAFRRLDAAFSDEADEDRTSRPIQGHILGATAVLDEWGILVPDSLAIASFAWGLGHMLRGGAIADLIEWDDQERDLKECFASILAPLDPDGRPRSLTWRDLRAAASCLGDELNLQADLWMVTPCTVRMVRKHPPPAEILSSFLLGDLRQVLHAVDRLPHAAAAYLGLAPPAQSWDALTDRAKLSDLLQPALFPLGRWPGPGLHPLTLLQQAAVNAIVRDLDCTGLAAVNGPPGTGKTTLLRDLVAHVLVSRAEALATLEDPCRDLSTLDLMDFAIVVTSNNNAAVENISLELPVRAKALDPSIWRDGGLDYFGHTANAVLGLSPTAAEEERAWGLLAARLGKADNRQAFFRTFWRDPDWGLDDWLNLVGWPDTFRNRSKPPGKLAELDPPPRRPQAEADWRKARDDFTQALEWCRRIRTELEDLAEAWSQLRQIEAQVPEAEARLDTCGRDLASAAQAVEMARRDQAAQAGQEATEAAKFTALASVAPNRLAKLFRTPAWRQHAADIRAQVDRLSAAQDGTRMADARLAEAVGTRDRRAQDHQAAQAARNALHRDIDRLSAQEQQARAATGDNLPGPGFWSQPDADLQRAAPWNGGPFRSARDALFAASIRLHRAFIILAVHTIKPSLNIIAAAAQGGPNAPKPSATDWGLFFLLVPVVSTTFAATGRMFPGLKAASLGWLLVDEAGQATPQAAAGAIWRARRAVVIGDPLQIEPVVTTPPRTTRLIFEAHDADPAHWAAPEQSAQTLADRTSPIQGRFRVANGGPERQERVTGMPLLVHRRCAQPMFDIANRIAYDDRMVFATPDGASAIRDHLGPSAWIDVDAPSIGKWVQEEGDLIAASIISLCRALPEPPDLYVISPFRNPALQLKALLRAAPDVLPHLSRTARKAWIDSRIGTIHTFQGKEAEAVIVMLGAGRGAKPGSRTWAGGTPNLLNVAATRARRVLYVIGNRAEWQAAGVFAEAALHLDHRPASTWLPEAAGPELPQPALP